MSVRRFLNPVGLMLIVWLFTAINYNYSLLSYNGQLSVRVLLYVAGFLVIFVMGFIFGNTLLYSGKVNRLPVSPLNTDLNFKINNFLIVVALVGMIGNLLLAIDFIYFREIDYSQGVTHAREVMYNSVAKEGVRARLISVVARTLVGFSTVAAFITMLRYEDMRKTGLVVVLLSLVSEIIVDVMSGTRNPIAMTVAFILMAFIIRSVRGNGALPKDFPARNLLIIGLILVFYYFSYIFLDRENMQGRDVIQALDNIEEGFLASISQNTIDITRGNEFMGKIVLVITFLQLYITHGLNELDILLHQTPEPGPFYGLYTLYIPAMLADKLGIIPEGLLSEVANSGERYGVYQTILGSLFLDFGYIISLIVIYIFGLLSGYFWRKMIRNDNLFVDMICAYILLIIICSPVYMLINYGNGFQILVAIMISGIIYSVLMGSKKTKYISQERD